MDPRFSEADPDFDPSRLSPEQRRVLDAANASVEALTKKDLENPTILEPSGVKAGYKIEVFFGPGRTTRNDYKALVSLYESGKHFNGGGDSVMYFCLDHKPLEKSASSSVLGILRAKAKGEGRDWAGCGGAIPSAAIRNGVALCPNCGAMIKAAGLTLNAPFFGSTDELSELIEILFRTLKGNADIYCKYDRTDVRYLECEKKRGLEAAHRLRGLFIYPLSRIVGDTSNGASLKSRIKAFLSA